MARYDVFFFDHSERIYSTERVECADDGGAILRAHDLNVPSIGAGFEVWQEQRFVYRAARAGARPRGDARN